MAEMINMAQRLYMADDGALFPVTNWFDRDGDECEPEDAVTAVAGEGGCWFALDLATFAPAEMQ